MTRCVSHAEILNGDPMSVLQKGRDMVHEGWELVANPLYGNFKPNQQPYRTLLLKKSAKHGASAVHLESLDLIEGAINVYRSSPALRKPGELPESIDGDFRYLDCLLLEETFRQCGMLVSVPKRTAGR